MTRVKKHPTPTKLPTSKSVRATVELLLAIAHPLRLRMLCALHAKGPTPVGELQKLLGAEQSGLSHQLRTLRDADLVAGERDGRRILYRLVDEHVGHIISDAMTHAGEVPRKGKGNR